MVPKKEDKRTKVHNKLEGFEIRVNEFGERISNRSIEELNKFLNEEVEDKKLSDDQLDAMEEE